MVAVVMQRLRVEHGIVLATLCFTMAYLSYRHRAFQLEDALIYQRYIQNVLDGHGLLYNPGEVYNGLTSPLYTYLLLATSWAVGDVQNATALLFALFMIGALAAFVALLPATRRSRSSSSERSS